MAAKTQLKDRVTGEKLYPVITKDCIPGTEIITTDNVPVIPYDENYGPAFFEQRIIPIGKFATGHSDANKVGFGFKIDNATEVYKPESDIYEYGCPIVYDNPNEFIHNYKVPVTNDVNDYTGALNLTTARYVQKLIEKVKPSEFKLLSVTMSDIIQSTSLSQTITFNSDDLESLINAGSYYIEVETRRKLAPNVKVFCSSIEQNFSNMGNVDKTITFKLHTATGTKHDLSCRLVSIWDNSNTANVTITDTVS